jgi:mono/diheme cytochrome c family protein
MMIYRFSSAYKSTLRMAIGYLAVSLLTAGCRCSPDNKETTPTASQATTSPEAAETPEAKLLARGKLVYSIQCIACHNRNPKMPGSLGPDLFGSSKELLTARILRAQYPDGYKPKRESHAMPPMPAVAQDIEALAAYLNTP